MCMLNEYLYLIEKVNDFEAVHQFELNFWRIVTL